MLGPIDRNLQPPAEGSRLDAVTTDSRSDLTSPMDPQEAFWVQRARDAWSSGKDWFDGSVRKQIEANLAHYRNQHAPGSKYYTETYAKKSNMFRPRTRAMVRRTEAAMAIAYFSTADLVNVSAVNPSRPDQVDGAALHNHLLNWRLENTLPWFQILMGGAQDASNTGVVISKQYWDYQTRMKRMADVYELEDGGYEYEDAYEEEVIRDQPCVELIAIENLLLSPAANWLDPINTSPYLVEMIPTYVYQIFEKMKQVNPRTGGMVYRETDRSIMAAALQQDWDTIRKAREGARIDKYEADTYINEYQIVWVHRNIVRVEGVDWTYDTLGTEVLLSDPEPLEDVFPHLQGRERPYKMGTLMLEAHKLYPMAPVEMVSNLQKEINDLANLRMDNVKLGLNKRYFVERGAGVDVGTLIRNVAGSAVFTNKIDAIKETQPQDITASSFQEQDRLNLEMDEVAGNFSAASVGTNRQLNETVGGMSLLSSDASQLKEYEIRTISETWVEGMLRQLVLLEAFYETDEEVLEIVAASANLPLERVLEVITSPVRTRVNVGFNSTAPERRVGKIIFAFDVIAKFAPQLLQGLNVQELLKELFGAVGYRDGERFFSDAEDPQVAQLKAQIAELQQIIETKQIETQGKVQVAQVTGEYRLAAVQLQAGVAAELGRIKAQIEMYKAQLEEIDRQLAMESADNERKELSLQREALSHKIQESNREFMVRLMELSIQREQGPQKPGEGGGKARPSGGQSKGAYNLPGNDKAGVLARDRYGAVPQNAA